MYVQAIPGTSSPMIYSAVVGGGGVSGTPQLVQWKTTTSGHHPGLSVRLSCVVVVLVLCLVRFYSRKSFVYLSTLNDLQCKLKMHLNIYQ